MSEWTWPEALNAMERDMLTLRDSLEDGVEPESLQPAKFTPPTDSVGPIPEALIERARALMTQATEIDALLQANLAKLATEITASAAHRPAAPEAPTPKYLDQKM